MKTLKFLRSLPAGVLHSFARSVGDSFSDSCPRPPFPPSNRAIEAGGRLLATTFSAPQILYQLSPQASPEKQLLGKPEMGFHLQMPKLRRSPCIQRMAMALFAMLCLLSPQAQAQQEHPMLICKRSQFDELRARAATEPWKTMAAEAIASSNAGFTMKNGQGLLQTQIGVYAGAVALAYIVDPNNRTFHANRAFECIQTHLKSMNGGSNDWERVVPILSATFNCNLLLDIVYDDLTPEQIKTCEDIMLAWMTPIARDSASWPTGRLGAFGTWDIYKGVRTTPDDSYYSEIQGAFTEDGVGGDSVGYGWARVMGTHDRLQKAAYMDVLEFTGIDKRYYNDESTRDFFRWIVSDGQDPSGNIWLFGDMHPEPRVIPKGKVNAMLLWRLSRYGPEAGGYAARVLADYDPTPHILPYVLMNEPLLAPLHTEGRIYEKGGAFLREKQDSVYALGGALYNITSAVNFHTHQEVNGLALAGFGNHLLVNGGWLNPLGNAADKNNTLTINGAGHKSKSGAGIEEGFVGGDIDYACGLSGVSLGDDSATRSLVFIHPNNGVGGYFVVIDDVDADLGEKAHVYFQTASETLVAEVSARKEYLAQINHHVKEPDVQLSIFYGTEPSTVNQVELPTSSTPGFGFHRRMESIYDTNTNGDKQIVTVLFPHNLTNPKAAMERFSGLGFTGVRVEQAGALDLIYESDGKAIYVDNGLSFQAKSVIIRSSTIAGSSYFVRKAQNFSNSGVGFESAANISIFMKGTAGMITSPGAEVTFRSPGIRGIRLGGASLPIISQGNGFVQVYVRKGQHTLELSNSVIPPAAFTVTYNSNGSTGGTAPVDANSPYIIGNMSTVLGNTGSLVKTGNVFGGWNTAADGTGINYAAGATFAAYLNTVLYAKWIPIPTITTVSPNVGLATGGTTVTIKGTNLAGTSSVTFDGTPATSVKAVNQTSVTCVTPAKAAGTVNVVLTTPGGSVTKTGAFTYVTSASCTVSFDANGGTSAIPASKSVTLGGTYGSSFGTTTRSGYTSKGWFTAPSGGTKVVSTTVVTTTTDHTLYVQWVPVPTITSISPSFGAITGGTTVTITGTNFAGTSSVKFDGTNATSLFINGQTSITCVAPAKPAGVVSVVLTAPGGSATQTAAFTYGSATNYTVTYNANGGSTASPASKSVAFGGTYGAFPTTSRSGYVLKGWYTASSGGTKVETSTTVATASNHTLYAQWTFGPTITTVSPSSGPATGGTTVTITGSNLTGTSAVTFGGFAATSVTVVSATSVTCVTPAKSTGAVNVALTASSGSVTKANAFTYGAAASYTVSFNANGGTTASPTSKSVAFGGTYGTLATTSRSGYTLKGWYTAASGGTKVETTTTMNTASDHTLYAQWAPIPTITTVTPISGPTTGGTTVTITGTNLTETYLVTFGGMPATSVTVVSATSVTCVTPARSAGAVDVILTTPGGSATKTGAFTYVAAANYTVTFDANGGIAASPASKLVTFGSTYGTLATTTRSGYALIGWYTATSGGTKVETTTAVTTASNHTLYAQWNPVPTITTVSPISGPTTGGTTVTITGTNLTGTSAVTFGGTTATSVTVVSATSVTCVTPAKTAGLVDVVLTTLGGSATKTGAFTFAAANYTVTFNANGGSSASPASKSVTFGSTYGTLATTTRTGYILKGWYTATTGGTKVETTTPVTTASNHTLYAQWNSSPTVNAGLDQNIAMGTTAPWTPAEITTAAWYDASDTGSITSVSNAVSQWNDKSGNNRHATQGTSTNRPSYLASDSKINNQPSIGTSVLTGKIGLNTPSMTAKNVYVVSYYNTGSDTTFSGYPTLFSGPGTNGTYRVMGNQATTDFITTTQFNDAGTYKNGATVSSITALPMAASVFKFKSSAARTQIYSLGFNAVTADRNWQGSYSEWIFTDGTEDAATEQKIEGYLAHKWGLAASLPAGHPYKAAAPTKAGATVTLDGNVSDPESDPLTTTWSMVSGPAAVAFTNASAVDTTATFSVTGVYTLRLTANDGASSSSDDCVINVQTAFDVWVGGSGATFDGDSNNDSIADGLAWLLGATTPQPSANALLPSNSLASNGALTLSFKFLKLSKRGTATLTLQYSKDLGVTDPWTNHAVTVPDSSGTFGGVDFVITPIAGTDLNQVQATVPASAAGGGGKAFVRLSGVFSTP